MDEPAHQIVTRFFDALVDPDRLRIAGRLADGPCTVSELGANLGLKAHSVMRHLVKLEAAGLIASEDDQGAWCYRLDIPSLRAMNAIVRAAQSEAVSPELEGGSDVEQKILQTFFDGEWLTSIPVARDKRLVILRWLAGQFEPGRTYPEVQVNEILNRHHDDHALLRRELVDEGLMERERGVYRRSFSS